MTAIFLKIINMGISAGWLILAVLVLRLALKKAPKWANALLWGMVAVRLLCPLSIESAVSLIPSAETISPGIMMEAVPTIQTGIPVINHIINPVISRLFAPSPAASANPLQIWIPALAGVWAIGAAILLVYADVHERAHILRRDHWWKPLGFLLLTVHWLNPLVWAAYVLMCRDMELACDEKTIREFDKQQRLDYAQALLSGSASRPMIPGYLLALGKAGLKERVKFVENYKKPALGSAILAGVVCAAFAVCFLTDPVTSIGTEQRLANADNRVSITESALALTPEEVQRWFDYLESPGEMNWSGSLEINVPQIPDVTFRWSPEKVEAVKDNETVTLYTGMPIYNAYFCDLTGDGIPELCSTLSMGSGIIDSRIIFYDYADGVSYHLSDRGMYDYELSLQDGRLVVTKYEYATGKIMETGYPVIKAGLVLRAV